MAHIRILKPVLIGQKTREPGEVVELSPKLAELHVRAGTGAPAEGPAPEAPPIEQATAPQHGRSEKAVSPRQRGG